MKLQEAKEVAITKAEENKALEKMQLEFTTEKGKVVPELLMQKVKKDLKYKFFNDTNFLFEDGIYQKADERLIKQKIKKYLLPEQINPTILRIVLELLQIDTFTASKETNKYLATNNGIMDLETFQFIKMDLKDERRPDYLVFYKTDCNFTERSVSEEAFLNSRFYEYLKSTFDDELIPVIQQVFGMCLCPNPKKFQKCIFLLGSGSNGKSLLLSFVEALIGYNASHVPMKDIDGNRFAVYDMIGKPVNIDADASRWRLEETEKYKKITGGDSIRAEGKQKQGIDVTINNVMLVALNSMPMSNDKTHGFVRRNLIIPFTKKFVDKGQVLKKNESYKDPNLCDYIIKNELDIILAFALRGLKMIRANNYKIEETPLIEKVNYEYQLENNSVLAFYDENKNGIYMYPEISASVLYDIYTTYCKNNEIETPVGRTSFGKEAKKYWKTKKSNTVQYLEVRLEDKIASSNNVIIMGKETSNGIEMSEEEGRQPLDEMPF